MASRSPWHIEENLADEIFGDLFIPNEPVSTWLLAITWLKALSALRRR
jgi:hypothetical protein